MPSRDDSAGYTGLKEMSTQERERLYEDIIGELGEYGDIEVSTPGNQLVVKIAMRVIDVIFRKYTA